MARVYYKRIKAGIMTIEDVRDMWRTQTQELLDADAE